MSEQDARRTTQMGDVDKRLLVNHIGNKIEQWRERYQGTEGGSFENGRALGRFQAYKSMLNDVADDNLTHGRDDDAE